MFCETLLIYLNAITIYTYMRGDIILIFLLCFYFLMLTIGFNNLELYN